MDSEPTPDDHPFAPGPPTHSGGGRAAFWLFLLLVALTAAVYVGSAGIQPLLDDTDSLYAEVAREMNLRADWITPYANGIRYFEKPPLFYWLMSLSYTAFGAETAFTARLPTALTVVALVTATFALGRRLFGVRAGFFGALALASSAGMFLFTRIVLPDALLTLMATLFFFAFVCWRDAERKTTPLLWMYAFAAGAVLVKGFIGVVFPAAAVLATLAATRRLKELRSLVSIRGLALFLAICVPWLVLMERRNPGFLWYFVVNEHVLRFLGTRQPMDYGAVPLPAFWGLHLVWLFPWSIYLAALAWPANARRAAATYGDRLIVPMAWAATVVIFFSFSSSRLEYYTMPAFPALALLAGVQCAACWDRGQTWPGKIIAIVGVAMGAALLAISAVNPATLAATVASLDPDPARVSYLGQIFDLTDGSIPALRMPLWAAALALGVFLPLHDRMRTAGTKAVMLVAAMLVLFGATESAFWIFAPRLTSAVLAQEINRRWQDPAAIIVDGDFEGSTSVAFYTQRPLLLHEGHSANLEHGAAYPDAPALIVDTQGLSRMWAGPTGRVFLVTSAARQARLAGLIGGPIFIVARLGDKMLLSNLPDGPPPTATVSISTRPPPTD